MSLTDKLAGLLKPVTRAAVGDLVWQLEALAARLEQHTVNLAEHQAQLRDEALRAIVNEMRSNSSFLADSVVALERAHSRRVDSAHAAVRPLVHVIRGRVAGAGHVVLVDHVDPILVDELVAYRHRVSVVEPGMDFTFPDEVVVSKASIDNWRGPGDPVDLVVWVTRRVPTPKQFDCVRAWMREGASLIFGAPSAPATRGNFSLTSASWFCHDQTQYRLAETAEGDYFVGHLRAE
jgi:hypothetical protein